MWSKRGGAFSKYFRKSDDLCTSTLPPESPPHYHQLAYATGGLEQLYRVVQGKVQPHVEHEFGSHTTNEGRFSPKSSVSLLASRYRFINIIGVGASAVIIKAEDTFHRSTRGNRNRLVAIKVLNSTFFALGPQEAGFVQALNRSDPDDYSCIVRLLNTFQFDTHYCMVYEYLDPLPLHLQFREIEEKPKRLKAIRKIALKLLQVLGFLRMRNVIHADLKPENILLQDDGDISSVKVIDFGNAVHCTHSELSLYYQDYELQTPLYRSPEVMFGIPFGPEIDMWSLGCILVELYVGKPLFLGKSKMETLEKMVKLLGPFPFDIFQRGKFFTEFNLHVSKNAAENETILKNLFEAIVEKKQGISDFNFLTFIMGLLKLNPNERMTPSEAFYHPFLAPEVPTRFFMPKNSVDSRPYSQVVLTNDLYKFSLPNNASMDRKYLSSIELVREITSKASSTKPVVEVQPFNSCQREEASSSSINNKILPEGIISTRKRSAKVVLHDCMASQSSRNESTAHLSSSPRKRGEHATVCTKTTDTPKRKYPPQNLPTRKSKEHTGKEMPELNTSGHAESQLNVNCEITIKKRRGSFRISDVPTVGKSCSNTSATGSESSVYFPRQSLRCRNPSKKGNTLAGGAVNSRTKAVLRKLAKKGTNGQSAVTQSRVDDCQGTRSKKLKINLRSSPGMADTTCQRNGGKGHNRQSRHTLSVLKVQDPVKPGKCWPASQEPADILPVKRAVHKRSKLAEQKMEGPQNQPKSPSRVQAARGSSQEKFGPETSRVILSQLDDKSEADLLGSKEMGDNSLHIQSTIGHTKVKQDKARPKQQSNGSPSPLPLNQPSSARSSKCQARVKIRRKNMAEHPWWVVEHSNDQNGASKDAWPLSPVDMQSKAAGGTSSPRSSESGFSLPTLKRATGRTFGRRRSKGNKSGNSVTVADEGNDTDHEEEEVVGKAGEVTGGISSSPLSLNQSGDLEASYGKEEASKQMNLKETDTKVEEEGSDFSDDDILFI